MNKNYKSNKSLHAIFLVLGLFLVIVIENSSQMGGEMAPVANTSQPPILEVETEVEPEVETIVALDKEDVLTDPKDLIGEDFTVPAGLENRVGFWFDIYSKYDSTNKVIHHMDYPWIHYEVFNIADILARPARFPWINPEKADKETLIRLNVVRAELRALAKKLKKKTLPELSDREKIWITQLQSLPGSIAQNVRKAAERVRVQTGQKDFFSKGLSIANRYLPHMEKIFQDHGLPKEIARLPLVESSFNKMATSKVGAAGLWQFMDGTGKKFLVINSFIDERRSPLKSTEAAAELLKENYLIMSKSWPLAITAYNHGPGGLKKAMKKLKTKDIVKIINYYQSRQFSFASENFYSEFLAALYVETYSNDLWTKIERQATIEFEPYKLTRRIKPSKIFKMGDISKEELMDLNPDIKKSIQNDALLPKGFILFIHPEKVALMDKIRGNNIVQNQPAN
ncbi:MAG: lytic transglycosylase domain-containing protein [Bdellovibrionaceae bacterium]|nr:lytic transglycosylase domain-containing protein [Pseudobdellovibrionaceae bacterium]